MNLIALITWLNVVLLGVAMGLVGRARGLYDIKAPATTGHPAFERAFRAQMNTVEQTVMFLPTLWLAAHYGFATWAAALGALWLIGRFWYLFAYIADAEKRSMGFLLGSIAQLGLLIVSGIGLVQGMR